MFVLRASLLVSALGLIRCVAIEHSALKTLKTSTGRDAYEHKAKINEESFNHESLSVQSQASHNAFSATSASDSAFGSLTSSSGRKSPALASSRDDENVLGHSFSSSKSSAKKSSSSKKVHQVTKEQSVKTSSLDQSTLPKAREDFDIFQGGSSLSARKNSSIRTQQHNEESIANISGSLLSSHDYDEIDQGRETFEDDEFMDFLFDGGSGHAHEFDVDDRSTGSNESDKSEKSRSSSSSSSSSSEETGALEKLIFGSDESGEELNETDIENLSQEFSDTFAASDSLILDSDFGDLHHDADSADLTSLTSNGAPLLESQSIGTEHDIIVSEKESTVTDMHSADYGDGVVPQINELTALDVEQIDTLGAQATSGDAIGFNNELVQDETNHLPIPLALSSDDTGNTSSSESDEYDELLEISQDSSSSNNHGMPVPEYETIELKTSPKPLDIEVVEESDAPLQPLDGALPEISETLSGASLETTTVNLPVQHSEFELSGTSQNLVQNETEIPSNLIDGMPISATSTYAEVDTSEDVSVETAIVDLPSQPTEFELSETSQNVVQSETEIPSNLIDGVPISTTTTYAEVDTSEDVSVETATVDLPLQPTEFESSGTSQNIVQSETELPSNLIDGMPLSGISTNVEVDASKDVKVQTAMDVDVENVHPLLINNESMSPGMNENALDVETEFSQNVITDVSPISVSPNVVDETSYLSLPNNGITVPSMDEELVNEIPITEYTTSKPMKRRPYVQGKFPSKSTMPHHPHPLRVRPNGTISVPIEKQYMSTGTQTLPFEEYKSFPQHGELLMETNNFKTNAGPGTSMPATRRPAYKPDKLYSSTPLSAENPFNSQFPQVNPGRPRSSKSSFGPLYLPKSSLPINLEASVKSSSIGTPYLSKDAYPTFYATDSPQLRTQRPFYSKNSPSKYGAPHDSLVLDYSSRPSHRSPYSSPQPANLHSSLRRPKYTLQTPSFPVLEGVDSVPGRIKSSPSPLFSNQIPKPVGSTPKRPRYVPKPRPVLFTSPDSVNVLPKSSFTVLEGVDSVPGNVKSSPSPLFSNQIPKPVGSIPKRPKYVPKPRPLLPTPPDSVNVLPHYDTELPLDLYGNTNSLPQLPTESDTYSFSANEDLEIPMVVSSGPNAPSYLTVDNYPSPTFESTSFARPRNDTPLDSSSSAAPLPQFPGDLSVDDFANNQDVGIPVELDSSPYLPSPPVNSNTEYYPVDIESNLYPRPHVTSTSYESDFDSSSLTPSEVPVVVDTSSNVPYALASPPFPVIDSYPTPLDESHSATGSPLYSSAHRPPHSLYPKVSDLYIPSDVCPNIQIPADKLIPKHYFEDLEHKYEETVCHYMSTYSVYPPNIAEQLEAEERYLSYDVVIVGSEAGALSAIKTFSDRGLRTLVIESGSLPPPKSYGLYYRPSLLRSQYAVPYTATMPAYDIQKTVYVPRVLGGTLSLDTNVWDRGDTGKYKEWSKISPQWSWSTASRFYQLIESVVTDRPHREGVPVSRYAPESEAAKKITNAFAELGMGESNYPLNVGRKDPGISWLPCINEAGDSVLYVQKIFQELQGRENVHVALGTRVIKINFELDRAVSVDVVTPAGHIRTIYVANELILGGEPIGTVKLLYQSGIGDQSVLSRLQLPVQCHLPHVGKDVSYNPMYVGLGFKFDRGLLVSRWESDVGGLEYLFGQHSIRDGLAVNYLKVFLQVHDADEPNVQFNFFVFSKRMSALLRDYMNGLFNFDDETQAYVYGLCQNHDLLLAAPQLLDADSKGEIRVTSPDYRDAPVVDTGMYRSRRDMKTMLKTIDVIKRIAKTKVFRRNRAELFQIPVRACGQANFSNGFNECSIRHLSVSSLHLTGGAIMGKHRSTSVVDEDLVVHGTRNVRCFSSAVIPFGLASDSAAPASMIGRYGAYLKFKKNSV